MSQPSGIPPRIVSPKAGLQAWTKQAYDVLVETASHYNAVITYGDLAEEVQARSGLRTTANQRSWIGEVLHLIAYQNHRTGEPPLTALVVHKQDGHVGAGYDEVLRISGIKPIDDPIERENHAAAARLECYRHWCPYVPADAKPTLAPAASRAPRAGTTHPRTAQPRTVQPRRTERTNERHGSICPRCFMEMPLTGECQNCT